MTGPASWSKNVPWRAYFGAFSSEILLIWCNHSKYYYFFCFFGLSERLVFKEIQSGDANLFTGDRM